MYDKTIPRHAISAVRYLLKRFPAVGIIGPRQCGKTTLCAQWQDDWKVYDLEKESDFEIIMPEYYPAYRVGMDTQGNIRHLERAAPTKSVDTLESRRRV